MQAMLLGERRSRDDVLVHPDRAVDLAAASIEAAEGKVRLDRVVVDLDHAQEHFERLVRLLVQQEAQALEIPLGWRSPRAICRSERLALRPGAGSQPAGRGRN